MNATFAVIVTCILLALNAFFVAGEFATTSSRRSQIEPLAEEGVRGSKYALFALEHVSLMLAICQLGVTVASTSLGVVAEPTFVNRRTNAAVGTAALVGTRRRIYLLPRAGPVLACCLR